MLPRFKDECSAVDTNLIFITKEDKPETSISVVLSQNLKRESFIETPEFPFWGLYICVDFNLRNQKTKI